MPRKIFVNLATKDVQRSKDFVVALGFKVEPKFSNDAASCVIVEENIFLMLLSEGFFKTFTPKELADPAKATEAIICLSCDSRQEVDEFVAKALAAGATRYKDPTDYGFMYGDSFADPDGHIWELNYMEPNADVQHIS